MTNFDPNAAATLVQEVLGEAGLAARKMQVHELALQVQSTRQQEAINAERDLLSHEQGHSHTRVFDGGVWRERPAAPTEAILAKRSEIRTKLAGDLPSRLRTELQRQLAATYQPK